ncbi:hypothetical protein, partial [Bacillus licheniformis]|uniref:hypothetical protein n=1 Tax=Bacillus licheniformis TaxID=1402 RepID=UPI001C712A61
CCLARRLGQKCGKEPERRKLCRAYGLVGSARCTLRKAKGKRKKDTLQRILAICGNVTEWELFCLF